MSEVEKQKRIEEVMRGIAAGVEAVLNEQFGKKGFMLVVFDFHQPGISNYISNAQRAEMITTLRETADRLENNQDIPAAHTTIQ